MENVFTNIYETKEWGDNNHPNYQGSSGSGSDIQYNKLYIQILRFLILSNDIKSIVDLGCGDFKCGPLIYNDLNLNYTGYDAYKKLVENHIQEYKNHSKYTFIHSDFYSQKENIISADLCILKDVIQHWSLEKIYTFMDYITQSKKFRFILIVNCANQLEHNTDILDGNWRALNSNLFPLRKYNPICVGFYQTKQISIITC